MNTVVVAAIGILVARHLGPERYGMLALALAVATVFSALSTLGVDRVAIRDFSRQTLPENGMLGSLIGLKAIGGTLGLMASVAVAAYLMEAGSELALVVGIFSLGFLLRVPATIGVLFQSKLQSRYLVWSNSAALGVAAVVKLGLIFRGADVAAFATAATIEALVAGVILIWFYRLRGGRPGSWTFDCSIAKSYLKQGAPLVLSTLAGLLYVQFDKIMLGEMTGLASVGIYAVFTQLIRIPQALFASVCSSVTPAIMRSYADQDRSVFESRLLRVLSLNAWASLWIAIGLALVGHELVSLLFGQDYAGSRALMILLALSFLIQVPNGLRTEFALVAGGTTQIFYLRVVALALNIVLNILFIPRWGVEGAAAATLATIVFFDCLSSFIVSATRPYGRIYFKAVLQGMAQRPIWNALLAATHRGTP